MGDFISQYGTMMGLGTMSDFRLDFDRVDDFLWGGCWWDTSSNYCDPFEFQHGNSTSVLGSTCYSVSDINNCSPNPYPNLQQSTDQDDQERSVLLENPLSVEAHSESLIGSKFLSQNGTETAELSTQLKSERAHGNRNFDEHRKISPSNELSQRRRIELTEDLSTASSLKQRFTRAVEYIKESMKEKDILVQIWAPIKRGGRHVLTTFDQPFSLDPSCQRLVKYRTVSVNYQFPAEEDSNEAVGLPGRVFLGRLPEWTPDVQYFSSDEYLRVDHAQKNDVRGTLALPVFARGNPACLGVLEVVRTTRKINYQPELESICRALQAVNLRSSEVASVPCLKASDNFYQVALPEIAVVLRAVCETHRLPLAQTWVPCMWQGKQGSRHSDENYGNCVSTVDIGCHVTDPCVLGFHEACSEHHLLKGQGLAGKAFTTNQPCFSPDVTAFSKSEYPLSHYARMFGLRAAVAIRLRSIYTGNADYVLELFLPVECRDNEQQKLMLNLLSITIQQVCQSLRVVMDKELENELVPSGGVLVRSFNDHDGTPSQEKNPTDGKKCNSVLAQKKGKASGLQTTIPLECQKQNTGVSLRTHWDCPGRLPCASETFPDLKHNHQDSIKSSVSHSDSSFIEQSVLKVGKVTKMRRRKLVKNISLEVIQQHFYMSLKDAAKSIGVCPTTLKRICRQYGIGRWPSRIFQKVGHSLERMQMVIDSVQGVEGDFQISSLYPNFPHACNSCFTSSKMTVSSSTLSIPKQTTGPPTSSNMQPEGVFSVKATPTKSPSPFCSHSSSSSLRYSTRELKTHAGQLLVSKDASVAENEGRVLKQSYCEATLCASTEDKQKPSPGLAQISRCEQPSMERIRHLPSDGSSTLKVKVMYGNDNIRLNIEPSWGFQDLQQEVAKRFNIGDAHTLVLKYVDEDFDWVLLTCDDDLQECKDVYKSFYGHVIKLSVHHASQS